jgi:hypothetical protein
MLITTVALLGDFVPLLSVFTVWLGDADSVLAYSFDTAVVHSIAIIVGRVLEVHLGSRDHQPLYTGM